MGWAMTEIVVHSERGTPLHDELIDAFLHAGGFVRVDGQWHEILTMVPEDSGLAWILTPARFVGAA